MYFELLKRFKGNLPLLHPIENMEIKCKTLKKLLRAQELTTEKLEQTEIKGLTVGQEGMYERKKELKE